MSRSGRKNFPLVPEKTADSFIALEIAANPAFHLLVMRTADENNQIIKAAATG